MTIARDSVPVEGTWDAAGIFATVAAWEAELEVLRADLSALTAFQGRLGDSPSVLLEGLRARDETRTALNRLWRDVPAFGADGTKGKVR